MYETGTGCCAATVMICGSEWLGLTNAPVSDWTWSPTVPLPITSPSILNLYVPSSAVVVCASRRSPELSETSALATALASSSTTAPVTVRLSSYASVVEDSCIVVVVDAVSSIKPSRVAAWCVSSPSNDARRRYMPGPPASWRASTNVWFDSAPPGSGFQVSLPAGAIATLIGIETGPSSPSAATRSFTPAGSSATLPIVSSTCCLLGSVVTSSGTARSSGPAPG